jgi:capsular exopolysaccharide synthesis family protein
LAVALVLGGLLGAAVALVREVTNRTVRRSAELGRITDLPVLGVLPAIRRLWRGPGWQLRELGGRRISRYAEGLRLLRAALLNSRLAPAPRAIMFTAAETGVGCSTTVLGLARVVAALGQRVVVVDANLRRPSQHALLGLQGPRPGIADYVAGRTKLEDTIIDAEKGISLVPVWHPQADAADLLSSDRFQKLMAELCERFDLVLIDAAPSVGLADAKIVAGLADVVVLVARNGRSREEALLSAIAALEQAGGTVAGAVFSRADRTDRWITGPRRAERILERVR